MYSIDDLINQARQRISNIENPKDRICVICITIGSVGYYIIVDDFDIKYLKTNNTDNEDVRQEASEQELRIALIKNQNEDVYVDFIMDRPLDSIEETILKALTGDNYENSQAIRVTLRLLGDLFSNKE